MKIIAKNKKARFDYFIHQTLEAGIALKGSEVKAARQNRVNIKDSFVRIIKGEAFLFGAHFSHLETTNSHFRHDERRTRKLLLKRKEINKLHGQVSQKGFSIVPLTAYFKRKNLKLQIALVSGKKLYDKRESLKQKTLKREAEMAMKKWR
mgnify:FL=1